MNSKNKGNSFERYVGMRLSLWISGGDRSDLFARTILSGGQFTVRHKSGTAEGVPGDLMANHPRAFAFMARFAIECKHHRDLNLEQLLLKHPRKSTLAAIYQKIDKEASAQGLMPLLIAKQNMNPPLVILPGAILPAVLFADHTKSAFRYHLLHNKDMLLCTLDALLDCTDATKLLGAIDP